MTPEEMAHLVVRCQSGDRQAFEALFRETAPWVGSLARGIVTDRELASDCVQDVYLLAWKKIGHLRDPITFLAWLKRIAVNRALRLAQQKRRRLADTAHEPLDDALAGASTESHAARVAGKLSLLRALRRLPPQDRALLVVREMQGASYEELSALFSVPVGTIRSRLHTAKKKVLSYLSEKETNPYA